MQGVFKSIAIILIIVLYFSNVYIMPLGINNCVYLLQVPLRIESEGSKQYPDILQSLDSFDTKVFELSEYENILLDIIINVLENTRPKYSTKKKKVRMKESILKRLRRMLSDQHIYKMQPFFLGNELFISGFTRNFPGNDIQMIALDEYAFEVFQGIGDSAHITDFLKTHKQNLIEIFSKTHQYMLDEQVVAEKAIIELLAISIMNNKLEAKLYDMLRSDIYNILWKFEYLAELLFHEGYVSVYGEQSQHEHNRILLQEQRPFLGNVNFILLNTKMRELSYKIQNNISVSQADIRQIAELFVKYYGRDPDLIDLSLSYVFADEFQHYPGLMQEIIKCFDLICDRSDLASGNFKKQDQLERAV